MCCWGVIELMFARYPEISNRPSAMTYAVPADEVWVATHKVDGTNMSVIVQRDDRSVTYARRNGVLTPGVAFYGWETVVPAAGRWLELLDQFPVAKQVTVYGELFGGKYPHKDVPAVPGVGPVQRGVFYHPDRQFVAFDVCVDGVFLEYGAAATAVTAVGARVLPVVFSGVVADVLAWAHDHRAAEVDPAWYGFPDLPIIKGNKGEGWVVRPTHDAYTTCGSRVIFKIKNPTFNEGVGTDDSSAPSSAKPKPGTPTSRYVTPARVSNVLGKELPSELTFKNFATLVALVLADAAKDGGADEDAAAAKAVAANLVREYLKQGM
jgi:Rnl2 family RNA ligase